MQLILDQTLKIMIFILVRSNIRSMKKIMDILDSIPEIWELTGPKFDSL